MKRIDAREGGRGEKGGAIKREHGGIAGSRDK